MIDIAQQRVQRRRVAGLDAVDRERRGQNFGAFDVRRLAEVGGGAEVLDRRRQFGTDFALFSGNSVFGFGAGLPPSFFTVPFRAVDVLGLLAPNFFSTASSSPLKRPLLTTSS